MADAEVLAAKARRYYLAQQALIAAEESTARIDAAADLVDVQCQEAETELAALRAQLSAEADAAAILHRSVPSYVLKEDAPAYVARRGALLTSILGLRTALAEAEATVAASKVALRGPASGTLRTLEASAGSEAAHRAALVKAKERLASQISKEDANIVAVTAELSSAEVRAAVAEERDAAAQKVLAARRQELARAREAAGAALESVSAQRAAASKENTRLLHAEAHAAEQNAVLEALRRENGSLKAMLRGDDGKGCCGDNTNAEVVIAAEASAKKESAPSHSTKRAAAACTPSRGPSSACVPKPCVSSATPLVTPTAALMDQFKDRNSSLLGEVAATVRGLEQVYTEQRAAHVDVHVRRGTRNYGAVAPRASSTAQKLARLSAADQRSHSSLATKPRR